MNNGKIQLTEQQQKVLEHAARGRGGRATAAMLGMNLRNVRRHRQEIKQRIGLDPSASICEMVERARQLGLLD